MLEIEDLTIIWDSELSEDQWLKIAQKEYFGMWWKANSTLFQCSHPHCSRSINHLGPHMKLRMRFDIRTDDGKTLFLIDVIKCQSTE